MLESKLQQKCAKFAASHKVLVRKIHCEGRRGWPDLALIFPITGKTVWVEMKNPSKKGRVSVLQKIEHDKIRTQGAIIYVCDSYEEFMSIILGNLKD